MQNPPYGSRQVCRWALGLGALLLLNRAVPSVRAGEEGPPDVTLNTLEGLVGRWSALRATHAEEKRVWQEQQRQWLEEIALLEREDDMLRKQIAAAQESAASVAQQHAAVRLRQETLAREREQINATLRRAEAHLCAWEARIPVGLREPLAAGFRQIARAPAAEAQPMAPRAQNVLALLSHIASLRHGFHATRETLDTETGVRRQVDALYIGLARGFAVSPAQDWAASGSPGPDGWTWQPQPEHAAAIRAALEVQRRERPAQLIRLPLQISSKEAP